LPEPSSGDSSRIMEASDLNKMWYYFPPALSFPLVPSDTSEHKLPSRI
jgi:hypothetical protein